MKENKKRKDEIETLYEKATKEALAQAQDTDSWKGHYIKVIAWRNKNRELKVIS